MGVYLNSKSPFGLFFDEAASVYYIDKSAMLLELLPLVEDGEEILEKGSAVPGKSNKYLCVTRPRRFGKTVMASMIAAFFSKGKNSRSVFEKLKVHEQKEAFDRHINRHNVIYISLNEAPQDCTDYQKYINRIERRLRHDLRRAFPDVETEEEEAVWDVLNDIYEWKESRFIFVLDEWDYIFHREYVTEKDKKSFLEFLSNLLKGKAYVELVYMTGILPIAKYSSGSELNMFYEYTMAEEVRYSGYFGFTEREVDELFRRYKEQDPVPENVTREGLRVWYDGYCTKSGERLYNPRSVVAALTNNNLGNYWTSSGPYDEISYYIRDNVNAVREDLALMVSGIPVQAKVREYAATATRLQTKDEIFSAMVVYGFLNYEKGCVSIPNKELMDKFSDMLQKNDSLGYVYRLAAASSRMLQATKNRDTKTMAEILEYAHNTESPLLYYNNETELTMIVNLVYLAARDSYRMEREDKAGIGYVDFIFYPVQKDDDCIIIELKVGRTAEEALRQIKDRKYRLKFEGRLGGKPEYTGRILAAGIAYDKKIKKHDCLVEVLREAH